MKGFFNVLKGAYPSLKQLDKSLPVATGNTILRGSLMMEVAGEFQLTTDDAAGQGALNAPGPIPYFALQGSADPDVEMAGVVTGMPVIAPCEVETDQFAGTPTLGSFLMAGAGVLKAHIDDATACGIVTKAPYYRWSNAETVDPSPALVGRRTGNRVNVIALQTVYIPNLSTSV